MIIDIVQKLEIQETKAKYYTEEYERKSNFCIWLGLNLFRRIEKEIEV